MYARFTSDFFVDHEDGQLNQLQHMTICYGFTNVFLLRFVFHTHSEAITVRRINNEPKRSASETFSSTRTTAIRNITNYACTYCMYTDNSRIHTCDHYAPIARFDRKKNEPRLDYTTHCSRASNSSSNNTCPVSYFFIFTVRSLVEKKNSTVREPPALLLTTRTRMIL